MVCLKKNVQEITVNVVFDVLEEFPDHDKKKTPKSPFIRIKSPFIRKEKFPEHDKKKTPKSLEEETSMLPTRRY
jgi:hypothetical protein